MKNIGLIVSSLAMVLLFGCKKPTYTIKVEKNTSAECVLDINGTQYHFTETPYTVNTEIRKRDELNVSVKYISSNPDILRLSIIRDGNEISSVRNSGYLWILYTDNHATTSGSTYSSSSGGSSSNSGGSSSGSQYCGAPTKDGTPCKRKVKGGGYCWQHK